MPRNRSAARAGSRLNDRAFGGGGAPRPVTRAPEEEKRNLDQLYSLAKREVVRARDTCADRHSLRARALVSLNPRVEFA